MQHFSELLGLQHLDVSHLRGRKEEETKTEIGKTRKGTRKLAEEKETTEIGGDKDKNGVEPTEGVGISEQVETSNNGFVESRRTVPTERRRRSRLKHGLMS